jgi:hypothetical protein
MVGGPHCTQPYRQATSGVALLKCTVVNKMWHAVRDAAKQGVQYVLYYPFDMPLCMPLHVTLYIATCTYAP